MPHSSTIMRIEVGTVECTRPRAAGSNARLDRHGTSFPLTLARVTASDGVSGFGWCRASRDRLQPLVGLRLGDLFAAPYGASEIGAAIEFPLWDLMGKEAASPVYRVAAGMVGKSLPEPFRVPCYDTSLYFDDLEFASDTEATDLIAGEARDGLAFGHRAFKIKIGRGARHMPLEAGTVRDIAVIHAVRDAVGPDAPLMIDANNGYNLNLTKRVLADTAGCRIHWVEEPFHEDAILYRDLKAWLASENLPVLISDGEGAADVRLMDWARDGLVDVVNYDIFAPGFSALLRIGRQLDEWSVRTGPHHYGGMLGNYVTGHLAGVIERFGFVEWDEATTPALDTSGYRIDEGQVVIPNAPGFGLTLDEERFAAAVANGGFTLD